LRPDALRKAPYDILHNASSICGMPIAQDCTICGPICGILPLMVLITSADPSTLCKAHFLCLLNRAQLNSTQGGVGIAQVQLLQMAAREVANFLVRLTFHLTLKTWSGECLMLSCIPSTFASSHVQMLMDTPFDSKV